MTDYVLIQNESIGLGKISISKSVINHIVNEVINRDKSVFLDETRSYKAAPVIKIEGKTLSIALKVRVQYGKNVEVACRNLERELTEQLQFMVDYHDPNIQFNVVGFKFD
jgi:uncharacterized alkaline shock family protein YloU